MKSKQIKENSIKNDFLRIILEEREELKQLKFKYLSKGKQRDLAKYKRKLVSLYTDVRPLVHDEIDGENSHLETLDKLLRGKRLKNGKKRGKFKTLNNLMIQLDETLYEIGVLDPFEKEMDGDLIGK